MNNSNNKTQTDHLIIVNKKKRTCRNVGFPVPADHKVKLKKREKRDKYIDLARERKKLWDMVVTVIPVVIGILGTVNKGLVKGLRNVEIRARDNPNYSFTKICQNTQKRPGDLRGLAVTLTPVGNHQLTLVRKTLKGVK